MVLEDTKNFLRSHNNLVEVQQVSFRGIVYLIQVAYILDHKDLYMVQVVSFQEQGLCIQARLVAYFEEILYSLGLEEMGHDILDLELVAFLEKDLDKLVQVVYN